MTWLPPFIVCLPLAIAGALIAVLTRVGRRVAENVAIAAGATTCAACVALLVAVRARGADVLWFGGWHPGNVVGIGIAFDVDLASASIAVIIAVVVTASVVYSREYFNEVGTIFYVLLLAMLGSMLAFAFAADAFDMFVFYEVFSVAAYALSAYRVEKKGAYNGALQFALTNTVAGLFILIGIILLAGRTGELNLAAIGHALTAEKEPSHGLAAVSFAFVSVGLFTRGAVAPVHWWFDEVHANAPTPLCVVLSGAMVPLAIYGFARFYWVVYAAILPPNAGPLPFIVGAGLVSALIGSVMCLREVHLKRALAFSTVAHVGAALASIGLFEPRPLAAAALYLGNYALAAAGTFMAVGILRARTKEVEWPRLAGVGRKLPVTLAIFALGTFGIAGSWPSSHVTVGSGAFLASAATSFANVCCGAAFVRIFAVVFLWAGGTPHERGDAPWFMLAPAAFLVAAPAVISFGGFGPQLAGDAAAALTDRGAYEAALLQPTIASGSGAMPMLPIAGLRLLGELLAIAIVTAILLSGTARFRSIRKRLANGVFVRGLAALHCGDVGQYVGFVVATAAIASVICGAALH